jgi:hypothetical protein
MNVVISTTLHIYSSLVSIYDYFLGCLFGSTYSSKVREVQY